MRYELTDYEWSVIKPMLPNKPRGVPRVDDRRVLNGIFWVLRSGAPWRDLPESYGPPTTCYNRFVRWRRAGVWEQIMDALAPAHDAAVQMIDTSVVRVHQHGACIAGNQTSNKWAVRGRAYEQDSRRGGRQWSTGAASASRPVRRTTTDYVRCSCSRLHPRTMLLADRGYDADWIRALVSQQGAGRTSRRSEIARSPICFSPICIARAIWSSGSSTRSSNVGASRRDTTNSQPTISPSSSSHRSALWLRVYEFHGLADNLGFSTLIALGQRPEIEGCCERPHARIERL